MVCRSSSDVVPVRGDCPGVVSRCPLGTFPVGGSCCADIGQDAVVGGGPSDVWGPEASVLSSSAPGSPALCPRCCGAFSAPGCFCRVTARVGSPVAHGPRWSEGRCPCPGPVPPRPACGGGL